MCNTISTPILRSQVLGIGCHLQKGLLGAVEEQPIHQLAIAQCQCAELMGQGEDDVEVGNGQEVGLASGQPGSPLAATALRAASVAAGMIVVSHLTTVIALADVSAQVVGAAEDQVSKRLADMRTLGPTLQELGSVVPHDLTQAQGLVAGPCGGGKRSSGLTTCCTPAKLTCVYRAVVPIR